MQVRWLRRALRSLEQEAAFLAQENPGTAVARVAEADASTRLLVHRPEIGRPGRVPGTRELILPHFPYLIPYRVREGRVEILHVLHTSRRWPPGLGSP